VSVGAIRVTRCRGSELRVAKAWGDRAEALQRCTIANEIASAWRLAGVVRTFVRGDDAGNIELLYDSEPGSGDPYPPSPVTVTRDSITIEDGVTHLIDVYVSRP
jgi:hypothetical protein